MVRAVGHVVGLGVRSGLQCSIFSMSRIEMVYWVCVRKKPSLCFRSSILRNRDAGPRSLSFEMVFERGDKVMYLGETWTNDENVIDIDEKIKRCSSRNLESQD